MPTIRFTSKTLCLPRDGEQEHDPRITCCVAASAVRAANRRLEGAAAARPSGPPLSAFQARKRCRLLPQPLSVEYSGRSSVTQTQGFAGDPTIPKVQNKEKEAPDFQSDTSFFVLGTGVQIIHYWRFLKIFKAH